MSIWDGVIGASIGGLLSAGGAIYGAEKAAQAQKDAIKQAGESLDFAKEQYKDQKQNYDNYMADTNASASAFNATTKRKAQPSTNSTADMPMNKI